MIDFISLDVSYLDRGCLKNTLNPIYSVRHQTGEIVYPIKAEYYGLEFKITECKIKLRGSVHKFYNSYFNKENQNYNQFTFIQFIDAVNVLIKNIKIDPSITTFHVLEYGLNILPPMLAETIVNDLVISSKLKVHNRKNDTNFAYKQFNASDSAIKIYDKGTQYNLKDEVLRVEYKDFKSYRTPLETKTLAELMKQESWTVLFKNLITQFDKLQIIDPIPANHFLTKKEIKFYNQCVSTQFWKEKRTRNKKCKLKKEYDALLRKHNLRSIHSKIKFELNDKFTNLIGSRIVTNSPNTKGLNCNLITRNENAPNYETKRICLITGIDISCQKQTSKFVYTTTVKQIYENDPNRYLKLKNKFGPTSECELDLEFNYIAHNIRNKYHNDKTARRRRESKYRNSLFPLC